MTTTHNLYHTRVALADAGWLLVALDLHPDRLVPCTCGRTIAHCVGTRRSPTSCTFRLMRKRGKSVYICLKCAFALHEAIGTKEFDELVAGARKDIMPEAVRA